MSDDEGFVIGKDFNSEDYLVASYYLETTLDPFKVAVTLCKEASTALWKRPGVDEDLRAKHAAKIVDVTPQRAWRSAHNAAIVRVAHPHVNFGPRLPNLLTAIAGEGTFNYSGFAAIKLLDVDFPKSFLHAFQGPQFGLVGIRKMLQVRDRPIITGVLKPGVGASPQITAELARQAFEGGLDVAKDDEIVADTSWSPTIERVRLVMEQLHKAEDSTGEKKIFVANITDEIDRMAELYDEVHELGCKAVMVNTTPAGMTALRVLSKKRAMPIVAHFVVTAGMTRQSDYGVSSALITKLQRIAGADLVINANSGGRMATTAEEVCENHHACVMSLHNIAASLPAFGGGDWAKTFLDTFDNLKTTDFSIVAGGAIFGHPQGPRAGAAAMRQAWESREKGTSLEEYAKNHAELAAALERAKATH